MDNSPLASASTTTKSLPGSGPATSTPTAPTAGPVSFAALEPPHQAAPPPVSAPRDKHRVSRACVSCRQRKTRCDLYSHGTPGNPPCTRCLQEHLECTLATSRRGGRRPRRTNATTQAAAAHMTTHNDHNAHSPHSGLASTPSPTPSRPSCASHMTRTDIDGDLAAGDLLNPSDALNLLAQVADLDGDHNDGHNHGHDHDHDHDREHEPSSGHPDAPSGPSASQTLDLSTGPASSVPFYYAPISDGHLSVPDAAYLLQHYHEHYHPFFPVADGRIFDGRGIPSLAQAEPHLLTSILTVASKDDPAWHRVHEACASHMDCLVSRLTSRGSSSVGAVEALLVLAEWAPQRQQKQQHDTAPTLIGRGEEDQGAWMQIGVAIRLAYLQGLEQTGLANSQQMRSVDFERKRVAWAACYMSDREVSIRLGKGFWSRGPGPSTVLNAGDFPTLRTQAAGAGDLAQLFQARLEMTQLFSNAHDILYSSTTHREQLFIGGEYVRYIDDFTAVLRKWKLVWGGLSLTPPIKAALILSYEFLRLYINAFAFQATISRAITHARQSPPSSKSAVRPLFADLAGQPDARFIYESVDAANTLLSTLNDFIDPATVLRHMPLKYYLYVIYAAVFLFKARVAGALAGESGSSARRTVNVTIDRLQKSSVNPHGLGQRYARSLYLLWRKSADRAAAVRSEAAAAAAAAAHRTAAGTPVAQRQSQNQSLGQGQGSTQGPVPSQAPGLGQVAGHSRSTSNSRPPSPSSHGGGCVDSGMVSDTTVAAVTGPHAHRVAPHTIGEEYGRATGTELLDPLKGFSWRDLDGLGQFIGNDMNFLDITFATPMSDSDHGTAAMDTATDAWQAILWSGNDVVF